MPLPRGISTGGGGGGAADASSNLSDNTTNDVTSSKHGFAPKSVSDGTKVLKAGATPAWGFPSFHGVSVYTSSATVSLNNNTQLSPTLWDSENYDTDAFHSVSSNTGRLTVPAGLSGYYHVWAFFYWVSNSNGIREIRFDNFASGGGASTIPQIIAIDHAVGANAANYSNCSGTMYLAAGEYVQCAVNQTSGGALAYNGTQSASVFGMNFLGV